MIYTLVFLSSFVFVALKSIQQLNVVHRAYRWIVPTSMLMAVCEVYCVAQAAKNGFGLIVIAVGLGSGLGSLCATYFYDKLRK